MSIKFNSRFLVVITLFLFQKTFWKLRIKPFINSCISPQMFGCTQCVLFDRLKVDNGDKLVQLIGMHA